MKDHGTEVFAALRPYCIALSQISLSRPNDTLPQLKELASQLQGIDQDSVSQGMGNYVFFPLKPLLGPKVNEAILTEVFRVIAWLLSTAWFEHGTEMAVQLLILHTTLLAKAQSEEMKDSVVRSCRALFMAAKDNMNDLAGRPTLAHTTMLLMDDSCKLDTKVTSLETLTLLYDHLDGDVAASFLPGTVSTLSKTLLKVNQRSGVLVAGMMCLRSSIPQCLDGQTTKYRSDKWAEATASQIILALRPVLSRLVLAEQPTVQDAAVDLCLSLLMIEILPSEIFIEFLLQVRPQTIPVGHLAKVATTVEAYIDATPRILQSVDEQRKISMLNTLTSALPLLSNTAAQILSSRFILHVQGFLKFRGSSSTAVTMVSEASEAPVEPVVEYLSDESRDALAVTLSRCIIATPIDITSPEVFWLAEKANLPTYQYALTHLPSHNDLALRSIIKEARSRELGFRSDLIHVLYPLLSLPQPSLYTLTEISKICNYESVEQMIVMNADYIINDLSLSFVTLDITPRTPKILGVLVQLAPQMVELIDDVIDTFFDFLDDYHAYAEVVEGIFGGLSGVVKAVAKQEPDSQFQKLIEQEILIEAQVPTDKSFAERFDDINEDEETNSARKITTQEEEEDPDTKISKSYKIVVQILEKSQIFLSHESDTMKIRILQLIHDGIPVVATNENKFLPLVHLYWPQLTRRMQDRNPYVVASVLRVIAQTITFAGSFMRMRIKDDVIPFVQDVIQPARDKRGNLVTVRKGWEGTGRRKVAEGIQEVLKASIEDGGLVREERSNVLNLIEQLASKSAVLAQVLEHARDADLI